MGCEAAVLTNERSKFSDVSDVVLKAQVGVEAAFARMQVYQFTQSICLQVGASAGQRGGRDSLHLIIDWENIFRRVDLSRGSIPGRLQTRTLAIAPPSKIYMKVRFI